MQRGNAGAGDAATFSASHSRSPAPPVCFEPELLLEMLPGVGTAALSAGYRRALRWPSPSRPGGPVPVAPREHGENGPSSDVWYRGAQGSGPAGPGGSCRRAIEETKMRTIWIRCAVGIVLAVLAVSLGWTTSHPVAGSVTSTVLAGPPWGSNGPPVGVNGPPWGS